MTVYKVKTGHDQALIDLVAVVPQPRSPGIQATRRSYSASGSISDRGLYVELIFNILAGSTQYNTLLTQFGLNSSDTAAVTVYVRDRRWQWVRMNGTAVLPEIGQDANWKDYRPRDIVILIKGLEAAA